MEAADVEGEADVEEVDEAKETLPVDPKVCSVILEPDVVDEIEAVELETVVLALYKDSPLEPPQVSVPLPEQGILHLPSVVVDDP